MRVPRLRMFAGPNGSGKSTIKDKFLEEYPNSLGVYINPDDIEREIKSTGLVDFAHFKVKTTKKQIFDSLNKSTLLTEQGMLSEVAKLTFKKNCLYFDGVELNSYFVSPIADFLHERLTASKTPFAFETVMSHPAKIALLKRARSAGFRNYLYFVATEDPEINISRVQTRVKKGGHDVPINKIVSRYHKSLENLLDAIRETDRAYIYDNSLTNSIRIAEITGGKDIEIQSSSVPTWFVEHVLEKGTSAYFGPR